MIGLDSNNVNAGPNVFPVGTRACNSGSDAATNLQATLVWDSANAYIGPDAVAPITLPSLAAGQCADFYFNVDVARNSAAFDTTRRFHVEVG